MKYIFLIQARMSSSRFSQKIVTKLKGNISLLEFVYQRVLLAKCATRDNTIILISSNSNDDKLEKFLISKNIKYYRGDESNVYKRFYDYLKLQSQHYDYIFRICADNPFLEPQFINEMINFIENSNFKIDYLSYKDNKGTPTILTHYGFFCEMIKYSSFLIARNYITTDAQKEHVTPIFYKFDFFKTYFINIPDCLSNKEYRFTIDTKEDAKIIKEILCGFNNINFSYLDIIRKVEDNYYFQVKMFENIQLNIK